MSSDKVGSQSSIKGKKTGTNAPKNTLLMDEAKKFNSNLDISGDRKLRKRTAAASSNPAPKKSAAKKTTKKAAPATKKTGSSSGAGKSTDGSS